MSFGRRYNCTVKTIQYIVINILCESCIYGKQSRLPFALAKIKNIESRPLFLIQSDVCGRITPSTVNNKNYFVTFMGTSTILVFTYSLISQKS